MPELITGVMKNLDRGFYTAAKSGEGGPRPSYGYLADLFAEKGLVPDEATVIKGVHAVCARAGIKAAHFDHLAPAYKDAIENFVVESWALGKALAEQGICVKGVGADKVEKFFATTTSTILFPAFVENQIMLGILAAPILNNLLATTTNINSHVYQALSFTDVAADQQLKKVGEGATLPSTKITTGERTIKLFKYGRMLETTYEALRLQGLNVVSLMLQRIGTRIALDETNEAIETLIAGDGNTGSAVVDTDAEVTGVLDYDELTRLFLAFPMGYQMNVAVANATNLRTILNMAEFKDPQAGFNFQRTGVLPGPMGANWFRWDSTDSTSFSTDRILAIDNTIALEQVTEGGVLTEADKLIDKQIERSTVSKWSGFAKLDYNATQCLDITT